uniref:Zinc finger SWIM domain-containing protein 8-like n=1 Tax=Sinocyclocheilus grahami TaxID=75366 RepID=A0A672T618_SINGR
MELMFAEWEDGERFSFEDSDRFEEDSLCSFISEAESLCQNWRGWRKQSAGPNSPTVKIKGNGRLSSYGQVIPLVELSAKQVAFHIPFEVVEKVYPPVPEQLQLRIAYWSFPENEEDIRLYSCLANGSPDEFQRGEQLYRVRAVKDPLQIGFHLSATVVSPQAGQSKGAYNVAVMFDRCRITSCSCTCGAGAKWCAHVVALCLFRIHNASAVCLRAPVSESLSRLQRDQLQKFAQYLISELPQQILPTAQRLLDELLSSQSTAINTVCGAPDPTAGPSASDQSTWYLDESTLSDNIKKTLHKFCGPSPVVFSDVNSMYLSSTEPPAAAEWACLLRPLRGREPEGIWNLLSIVREMFKRRDSNAAPLLEILTEQYLLANPPDLKVEQPQTKGKKSKVSTSKQTQVATNTLSKVAFLLTVLSERLELHNLAFNTGMFSLELQRPPASTKALEVKLAYQESEVVALLKKIPLGLVEMTSIRDRAEQLRDGNFCDYRPVLPLMLASFIFDVLCTPVVSPTGSRPPSRNRNNEMPGDEELGFDAAVAAIGMKTTVSEAEHPLLCEGTRREKGDLALALMITYKDDQSKLKKILDKLLNRESQTHKPQTLSSFYSSKPATSSQKSPSKHAAHGASGSTGGVSKHTPAATSSAVQAGGAAGQQEGAQTTSCEQQSDAAPFKPEGTVPSRLALGGRGAYGTRCWGSPVRQKKKHTGMASIDSSAPETTSDSSPTLSRRPLRGGWTAASWGRGQDSDSISSSSSDSLGSSSSSGSRRAGGGARAKSTDTSRYKGRRPECHAPHVPNQPSEAAAHFYFELAKTVLIKAGGNSSTSIFTQPSASGGHQGPHRNLHLCAFEIGLYALGLHNFVSPNWLSRTYSSHVSWITGQAMEIGSAALNILVECWDGHLTPPEVASLADRASRARDPNMVRAAAELALSCLPHAHALNPNEIQRALVQCKEQDNVMLEKACMAVEEAAKGGGVYPEVLFEVAHQWYWLYEQTVGGGSGAQREGSGRLKLFFSAPLLQCRQEFITVLTSSPEIVGKPCYQTVGGVHSGSTIQAIQGTSFPGLSSQPASLVSAPFPVEDEQHNQPISQQGLHYLHSAYRVGMLALEMLGRRAHNDHPNNFSRSPPYTEDVKWLLGLAARLGMPTYLCNISYRKNKFSKVRFHFLHSSRASPVQHCRWMKRIDGRDLALTPHSHEASASTPLVYFEWSHNLKRGKQTKELWQRISLEMATFSP